MENIIDVSEVNLIELVKEAYNLSVPVGLGFLHYTPEPLTSQEAANLINLNEKYVVSLDYVNGRAVKFGVFKHENKFYIKNHWYDHTKQNLQDLLERVGIIKTI